MVSAALVCWLQASGVTDGHQQQSDMAHFIDQRVRSSVATCSLVSCCLAAEPAT